MAIVEALAAVKAVTFAQDIGLSSVIVEGDLEINFNPLKSDYESFVAYGHLILFLTWLKDKESSSTS